MGGILLFQAAAETMIIIAADPKHLGARIGITAVLHMWGSAMTHHPHIRMIVPGGGLSPDSNCWVPSSPAFLLAVSGARGFGLRRLSCACPPQLLQEPAFPFSSTKVA